jgi:hypothetical protein
LMPCISTKNPLWRICKNIWQSIVFARNKRTSSKACSRKKAYNCALAFSTELRAPVCACVFPLLEYKGNAFRIDFCLRKVKVHKNIFEERMLRGERCLEVRIFFPFSLFPITYSTHGRFTHTRTHTHTHTHTHTLSLSLSLSERSDL